MSLTVAELKALNLGYLSGADLLQFCVAPLLIKCYEADNDSLQNGCSTAYVQLDGNLSSRYDVESELALTTGRNLLCVKITAIIAIQNIFAGGISNIGEDYKDLFDANYKELLAIRNGQMALKLKQPQDSEGNTAPNYSSAGLIHSNFKTLG